MQPLNRTRSIVLAVHVMIVAAMLAIYFMTLGVDGRNPLIIWLFILVPVLVIALSLARVDRKARILGYWALAILMTPIAGLGIFGGWGLLYVLGILFLIWGAWMENEGASSER